MPTAQPEELSLVPIEEGDTGSARPAAGLRRGAAFLTLSRPSPTAPTERAHRGPGWFDSSWDLHAGCEVREGWPTDAVLCEWIESWLLQPASGATHARGGV